MMPEYTVHFQVDGKWLSRRWFGPTKEAVVRVAEEILRREYGSLWNGSVMVNVVVKEGG